jgi:hypothetical protein
VNTLDKIRAEIVADEAESPRSKQVMTGASQLYGCRAESLLRYQGVPESNPRSSYQAWVGKCIHAGMERVASTGVIVEQRGVYKGVPVTVDRLDGAVLTDFKTKDTAAEVRTVARAGPARKQKAQVNLGAAAMIEAGHDVTTVELLFMPRAGKLDDAWLWSAPFDRALADEAVEWAYREYQRAVDFQEFDGEDPFDGLRDEPVSFCRSYCPHFTNCRGDDSDLPLIDERIAELTRRYYSTKKTRDEAVEDLKMLREELRGVSGRTDDELSIRWQGGNENTTEEFDYDKILADYRALIGRPPTKTKTTYSSLALYVESVAS